MVPYADTVVAVTVMCVLLFLLHVFLLRECDGVRLTPMLVWGMDEVWCVRCEELVEYVRCGCVCVWLGAAWVEKGVSGLGLDFTNPVGTYGVLDMCLCFGCGCVGGVGGKWVGGLDQGLEG